MAFLIYGMVFAGSALMIYNIITFIRYMRRILAKGYWDDRRGMLYFPLILLIAFLAGYIMVGVAGKPDIIMSGILFFGSVYVTVILAVLKSITSRVEESERLEAQLRATEESSQAKTRFLSHMSHEIRTPMNAIVGMNELAMKNPDLPEESRKQLEKIDSSAHHMLDLINDILDMSRIESGSVELREDPFLLSGLLNRVNGIISSQCEDKGLDYECHVEGPAAETYAGDYLKIKQVLINILGNGVKFTEQGGISLRVEAKEPEEDRQWVAFVMKDTGVGLDSAFLPHLFDPFSQEDDTNTNRYGGSGLGMAITKQLVDMMGGEIQVYSEKGRGSTFTVSLPLVIKESSEEHRPAAKETENISLAGRRILYAEDIEINAEILGDLLEMEDMEGDWAQNGQAAVDLFAESGEFTYDAILMDLRMPVMDGLEAAALIRSMDHPEAKTIPIIAMTANAFDEDVQNSLNAGMNAHLSKPIDPDRLYETLSQLVK